MAVFEAMYCALARVGNSARRLMQCSLAAIDQRLHRGNLGRRSTRTLQANDRGIAIDQDAWSRGHRFSFECYESHTSRAFRCPRGSMVI